MNQKRTYRDLSKSKGLVRFSVMVKETDLLIFASKDLTEEANNAVLTQRRYLEERISAQPEFADSLSPLPLDPYAPEIIRNMLTAGHTTGTGPMAGVAGAMAHCVGMSLLNYCDEVIIENGGDIFVATKRDLTISIYAGKSPLSGKLGLIIKSSDQPTGVSTSSGTIGHSFSMGKADAATVLAASPAKADAAATALGNRIKNKESIQPALNWISKIEGIRGAVVIYEKNIGAWGDIELVDL